MEAQGLFALAAAIAVGCGAIALQVSVTVLYLAKLLKVLHANLNCAVN